LRLQIHMSQFSASAIMCVEAHFLKSPCR
jgi:hypothetical protein